MRLSADYFVAARLTVLLLAVVMLVGHICVLPIHSHVEASPSHGDEAQPHDADDAVHAGSCEALRSSGTACPPLLTISAFVVPTAVYPLNEWVSRGSISPRPTASPPIFLLHAALLI
jgi:hypothetical protein